MCMRLLICFCLLFVSAELTAVTDDIPAESVMTMSDIDMSLNTLNQIIASTERTLAGQRDILQQLTRYRKIKSEYLLDQQNKNLTIRLVKSASQLNESIQAQYLHDALDGEFLSEIAFFSKIANKKSLPKP